MMRKNVNMDEDGDAEPVRYTVLSRRAIALWAVLVVAVGVGMAVWLLLAYGHGEPRVQLDAIRTAGAVVVGAGGGAALLLAARRQRTAEIALKQKDRDLADVARAHELQERVAAATEADAAARRITELYTQAVEQLGSDKAPVRLGGLYALERLAQDNPGQRQTIVNVWCAYLRMPYTSPDLDTLGPDAAEMVRRDNQERVQEREVRLTAQRVLRDHLRPGNLDAEPTATFWPDVDLDLTRATLIDFNLDYCRVHAAAMQEALFTGITSFREARFTGVTSFRQAQFTDHASFQNTHFTDHASFVGVQFADDDATTFSGTRFVNAMPDELLPFWSPPADDRDDETELTDRERVLLALLNSGITDEEIADKLGRSVKTVRRMVHELMRRLGARSRFAAGAQAANRGWLNPQSPETRRHR